MISLLHYESQSFQQETETRLEPAYRVDLREFTEAEVVDWHKRFLKTGGYIIMTTPRAQLKSMLYYEIRADVMNHTYRELMTIEQMGLYLFENGLDILKHGYIKVHNGIIAQPR